MSLSFSVRPVPSRQAAARLQALIPLAPRLALPGAALVLIDVDDMGSINLSAGRAAGDALLAGLQARLRIVCGAGNPCLRMGGDRFALAITAHSRDEVDEAALSLLRVLQAPLPTPLCPPSQAEPPRAAGPALQARLSIGIARGPAQAAAMLDAAEAALTEAKAAGGHCWRVRTPQPAETLAAG